MTRSHPILAKVLKLDPEELSEDATLEAIGLDSLRLMMFIADCEEQFSCDLDMAMLSESLLPGVTVGEFCGIVDSQVHGI